MNFFKNKIIDSQTRKASSTRHNIGLCNSKQNTDNFKQKNELGKIQF